MARGGGGGAIIRGRRLFLIFSSKGGDYSREAINRGTAIIRGNTVSCPALSASVGNPRLKPIAVNPLTPTIK